MGDDLRIREAEPEDAERLREIGVMGWETTYSDFIDASNREAYLAGPFWSVERLRDITAGDRCHALVAEVAGSVVGFMTIEPHPRSGVELTRLYVNPEFRGSGIGRALWQQGLASLRQCGVPVVLVNVFGNNWSGRRFYEWLGFSLAEETTTAVGTQTVYDVWYRMALWPADCRTIPPSPL